MEQKQDSSDRHAVGGSVRKRRGVVSVLLLVVLLAVAGVGGYMTYNMMNKSSGEDKVPVASTSFGSTDEILTEIKPSLQGQQQTIASSTGLGGKTDDGYGLYGVASYKVGDRQFENLPAESEGIAYSSNSVGAELNYKAIVDFFETNHAKLLTSGTDTPGATSEDAEEATYVAFSVYETSGQVCMVWHLDATGTPIGAHVASVGCGEKESYKTAATSLDSFFDAYSKSVQAPYDDLVLGSPVLGEGVEGYEHAVVHQESGEQFEGLYYRTTGQDAWTYFLGVQGLAPCSEFTSDDVKKAFKDLACVGEGGKTESI